MLVLVLDSIDAAAGVASRCSRGAGVHNKIPTFEWLGLGHNLDHPGVKVTIRAFRRSRHIGVRVEILHG